MNGAVVLFVGKVEQANLLVERGLSVGGAFEEGLRLNRPATKITFSKVSPLIRNEFLCAELCRDGKIMSRFA